MRDDIYTVRQRHAGDAGLEHRPLGRVMVKDGQVHHLEDYEGHLEGMFPEGFVGDHHDKRLAALNSNPYMEVVPESEAATSRLHDEAPEADIPDPPKAKPIRQSVFEYTRPGFDKPHTLEMHGDNVVLDGQTLPPEERVKLLENLRNNVGTIRYRAQQPMVKMEQQFRHMQTLSKSAEKKDKSIYEDPQIKGMGNQYAWNEFTISPEPGVVMNLGVHGLEPIIDEFGSKQGDESIKQVGLALLRAAKGVSKKAKVFRVGKQFKVCVADDNEANTVARVARDELESLPPMGGTHPLSIIPLQS